MRALVVAALVAPLAACGVDSYLTCGAPCEDAGASDATLSDAGDGGSAIDAGNDVGSPTTDAGCKGDGGYCTKGSDCCSSVCNQQNRCASSCVSQGGACGSNGACCLGTFCADGGCVACLPESAPCTQDYQCCGNASCTGGYDGGAQHCTGN